MLSSYLIAMNTAQPSIHLVIIPGLNGLGGENALTTLPYFKNKPHLQHKVKTPGFITADLGQTRCMKYLHEFLIKLPNNDKAIIYAVSQGTATALNYASKNSAKIAALILEGVMLSGNSAISYNLNSLRTLPGSSCIAACVAKCLFPFYSPSGDQPIKNISTLPQNLPIIILHHTQDPQLSYKDAQACYAFLKNTCQNKNVYLISKTSKKPAHFHLLADITQEDNVQKIYAINGILYKNKLIPNINYKSTKPKVIIPLTSYQPKPQKNGSLILKIYYLMKKKYFTLAFQ